MKNKTVVVEKPAFPDFLDNRAPETAKWDYGHALLVAGSFGKMGAAVLAAKACLRMGAGLLTVHLPRQGVAVMQVAVPEAMVSVDEDELRWTHRFTPDELARYDVVGIGPGVGTDSGEALEALLNALQGGRPRSVVIDADGINMLARLRWKGERRLADLVWPGMVLTPHKREYERLFGDADPEEVCRATGAVIVCKSHRTQTVGNHGITYLNTTGNPAMATAGSGDVLTGMILGIMAQVKDNQMAVEECAALGVWIHGQMGDLAAEKQPQCSVMAGDLIKMLTVYGFEN